MQQNISQQVLKLEMPDGSNQDRDLMNKTLFGLTLSKGSDNLVCLCFVHRDQDVKPITKKNRKVGTSNWEESRQKIMSHYRNVDILQQSSHQSSL